MFCFRFLVPTYNIESLLLRVAPRGGGLFALDYVRWSLSVYCRLLVSRQPGVFIESVFLLLNYVTGCASSPGVFIAVLVLRTTLGRIFSMKWSASLATTVASS